MGMYFDKSGILEWDPYVDIFPWGLGFAYALART